MSDSGLDKGFLRRCLWATGWCSAGLAVILWNWLGTDGAGRYATVALFAWINWVSLAKAMIALLGAKWLTLLLALGVKIVNLAWFVGAYLPRVGAEPFTFLLGMNTFFLVVIMKIVGRELTHTSVRGASALRSGADAPPPEKNTDSKSDGGEAAP